MTARLPRITLVSTGGTISAVGRDRLDLSRYGDTNRHRELCALLDEIPELAAVAEIHPEVRPALPSHGMGLADLLDLGRLVRRLTGEPNIAGVVVTYGTNTLEETAFFMDLVCPPGKPVVVTGAMRPASGLSADGPLNLLNAVRLAASPGARGRGVLVLLDDTIHAARDATKAATNRVAAFRGGEVGPLGFVESDGTVVFHHRLERWPAQGAFDPSSLTGLPRVDVVVSYLGADGAMVEASVRAGAAGIVSAGTGAGYPTPAERAALERAAEAGVVVCQASRVAAGRVTPRPEAVPHGFVTCGNLNPWKTRLLLALALTHSRDPARIQPLFDR
ncbi:asparaginase [Rhizomonospora bruguierae]|uniref:asparaginase n=1 Tax=Rhizomonospora bruguierae TaxID=1581705 RepID=UPI001BCC40AD|nr:asparaginase [Micromonospora sp. NBRC 107566]